MCVIITKMTVFKTRLTNPIHPLQEIQTSRIVFVSGVRGDTRRYRTFHAYEQLILAGADCELAHITDPDLPARLGAAQVVLFQRVRWDPYVGRLLDDLRGRGGLALLDVDDLIFDARAFKWIASPDFSDPVRAALYQEDLRRNRQSLQACAAVVASTGFLAEAVRALGKPAWIHRNAFSLEMLALSEAAFNNRAVESGRAAGRVAIGYASGTPTHNRDFQIIKPVLKEILNSYPQVELCLIGDLDPGEDWGQGAGRVRCQPLVPWRQLPALLARLDVNLAPLELDNPFSQSKSEIKYMEAALVRVPTVASPTDAFSFAIRDGENGCLAGDARAWSQALARLVEDVGYRRSLGERAYAEVLRRYHPRARAAGLVAALDEISAAVQGRPLWPAGFREWAAAPEIDPGPALTFRIDPEYERRPSVLRMGLYDLRHRGLQTLLMRAWIFFRRLAVPLFPFKPVP